MRVADLGALISCSTILHEAHVMRAYAQPNPLYGRKGSNKQAELCAPDVLRWRFLTSAVARDVQRCALRRPRFAKCQIEGLEYHVQIHDTWQIRSKPSSVLGKHTHARIDVTRLPSDKGTGAACHSVCKVSVGQCLMSDDSLISCLLSA